VAGTGAGLGFPAWTWGLEELHYFLVNVCPQVRIPSSLPGGWLEVGKYRAQRKAEVAECKASAKEL
jgi:hypothetical protein